MINENDLNTPKKNLLPTAFFSPTIDVSEWVQWRRNWYRHWVITLRYYINRHRLSQPSSLYEVFSSGLDLHVPYTKEVKLINFYNYRVSPVPITRSGAIFQSCIEQPTRKHVIRLIRDTKNGTRRKNKSRVMYSGRYMINASFSAVLRKWPFTKEGLHQHICYWNSYRIRNQWEMVNIETSYCLSKN